MVVWDGKIYVDERKWVNFGYGLKLMSVTVHQSCKIHEPLVLLRRAGIRRLGGSKNNRHLNTTAILNV
jgi:hypothetical protein